MRVTSEVMVTRSLERLGTRLSAYERTQTELSTGKRSQVEDVDMAHGIMELQVQQVAYEATLQALDKALPPSLVAFLR